MRCPACNAEILLDPKELAAILGARGGAAGRGEAKSRDKGMLSKAGKKGAAIRWAKTKDDYPPEMWLAGRTSVIAHEHPELNPKEWTRIALEQWRAQGEMMRQHETAAEAPQPDEAMKPKP